jgi:polyhydroxyalkanoate synthesis repressor PhaR
MNSATPCIIKKYGNRRLYNTRTSAYENVESLAVMAKRGDVFVVFDAKSGDDITRNVLGHIISEEEKKIGQDLLPIAFLRSLIGLYGGAMQEMVPAFLEMSMETLTRERAKLQG